MFMLSLPFSLLPLFIILTAIFLLKIFRPYAVGKNITEGMKNCDEVKLAMPEKIDYFLVKNKETGLEKSAFN